MPQPLTQTWAFSTANMPEGANQTITISGNDYAGNQAPPVQRAINVDRSPPQITGTDGAVTNGATLDGGAYDLQVQATDGVHDGNPAHARSGVSSIAVYDGTVDPGHLLDSMQQSDAQPPCTTSDSCSMTASLAVDVSHLAGGAHSFIVVATDGVGLSASTTINVTTSPQQTSASCPAPASYTLLRRVVGCRHD
jgi:hypothetical protein